MPKHSIVLFASCGKSRSLGIRLKHYLSRDEFDKQYVAHCSHATSPPAVRSEYNGKNLVVVAITGTREEAEVGFGILKEAVGKCPVVIVDKNGYDVCRENHNSVDFNRVRFLVKLGPGPFDPRVAECFAARGSVPVHLPSEDWVSDSIIELASRISDAARSRSAMQGA